MSQNLANLLRPKSIKDLVGQTHLKPLLEQIVSKKLKISLLLFGEAGIGKTSTAIALVNDLQLSYEYFNASVDNKDKLVSILENYDAIIIDEIHRLNKDKQDILLSYLEFDKITVYATTTENPYFKVNPALRSRLQILEYKKLTKEQLLDGLRQIINTNFPELNISDEILSNLARYSAGDFRASINNLQLLALIKDNKEPITESDLKLVIPNLNFYADEKNSAHYNNLSAFHKSLRGSDVNAALYYGFLILKSGDVNGLFRRMLCVAYEDVSLASHLVPLKVNFAINAFERLGFPEGELPIANAIIELANAPKSNSSYLAIQRVKQILNSGKIYEIPKHLRDSHYASASKLGDGVGYKYPHDYSENHNWVSQQYLPDELKNEVFYIPGNNPTEQALEQYWAKIKK